MSCQGEPLAKKQKTHGADGPVEDEESAREKLREAGFDPNDVHTARSDLENGELCYYEDNVTPMAYFASRGDLPMCRYLHYVREATMTAPAEEHRTVPVVEVLFSPMYAAIYYNQPEVAKWLFCHGAMKNASASLNSNNRKSLSLCFRRLRKHRRCDDPGILERIGVTRRTTRSQSVRLNLTATFEGFVPANNPNA